MIFLFPCPETRHTHAAQTHRTHPSVRSGVPGYTEGGIDSVDGSYTRQYEDLSLSMYRHPSNTRTGPHPPATRFPRSIYLQSTAMWPNGDTHAPTPRYSTDANGRASLEEALAVAEGGDVAGEDLLNGALAVITRKDRRKRQVSLSQSSVRCRA